VTWRCLLLLASLAVSPLTQANTVQVSQEVVGSCEFGSMPTIVFTPTAIPTNQTIATSFPVRCTAGLAVSARLDSLDGDGASGNVLRHATRSDTMLYSVHRTLAEVPNAPSYAIVRPLSWTGTGDWQSIPLFFYSRTTAARPIGTYSTVLTITLTF
jgi:spore coat protein U-like protein